MFIASTTESLQACKRVSNARARLHMPVIPNVGMHMHNIMCNTTIYCINFTAPTHMHQTMHQKVDEILTLNDTINVCRYA